MDCRICSNDQRHLIERVSEYCPAALGWLVWFADMSPAEFDLLVANHFGHGSDATRRWEEVANRDRR